MKRLFLVHNMFPFFRLLFWFFLILFYYFGRKALLASKHSIPCLDIEIPATPNKEIKPQWRAPLNNPIQAGPMRRDPPAHSLSFIQRKTGLGGVVLYQRGRSYSNTSKGKGDSEGSSQSSSSTNSSLSERKKEAPAFHTFGELTRKRFRPLLYRFLILFAFLTASFFFLQLINFNVDMLLLKVKWTLFSKSIHFLFSRIGWGFGIVVVFSSFIHFLVGVASGETPFMGTGVLAREGPSAPDQGQPAAVASSSASEGSVNQGPDRNEAGPSGANNPDPANDWQTNLPGGLSPLPSLSFPSLPSLSFPSLPSHLDGVYGREHSVEQPPAPSSSTGALPAEEPAITKEELSAFLSSFGKKRKASDSFILRTSNEWKLEHASPEKLREIRNLMKRFSEGPEEENSATNAAAAVYLALLKWDDKRRK